MICFVPCVGRPVSAGEDLFGYVHFVTSLEAECHGVPCGEVLALSSLKDLHVSELVHVARPFRLCPQNLAVLVARWGSHWTALPLGLRPEGPLGFWPEGINIRVGVALHASDPDDDDAHTPAACLTNGGCFPFGGTLTGTDTSPTLIVNFFHHFVGGVQNPVLYLPIVLRLTLQQACQRCQLQRVGAPPVEPSAAAQNNGWAQNVQHGGQPRGAESRRLRGAHGVEASGEADVPRQTFQKLWFGRERMSTRCEQMKEEHCGPSSTPQIWETKDGGQRSWKMVWHAICQAIFQGVEIRMGSHVSSVQGPAPSGEK